MSKRKRMIFKNPKMLSSRVESDLFDEFEKIIRYKDKKDLQEVVNLFVNQYVSGSLYLSGSKFYCK